ncbi:hypothetical protein SAMN05216573_117110 [Bradyrhizobium sp. Rc3b]|nr:hypothetical protein SAMN05216573_117110 [Bradyrhizobium sp. Rc3b]
MLANKTGHHGSDLGAFMSAMWPTPAGVAGCSQQKTRDCRSALRLAVLQLMRDKARFSGDPAPVELTVGQSTLTSGIGAVRCGTKPS